MPLRPLQGLPACTALSSRRLHNLLQE